MRLQRVVYHPVMYRRVGRPLAALLALLALSPACASERESSGSAAGESPKTAPRVDATRVEAAVIKPSSVAMHLVRPGEVEGAREAHLAAALGGFVEAVKVATGDSVKRGQVIAYVDTSTHNAQAKLTRVEVDDAERELARIEKLGSAVASARVDAARARLARAKAQHNLSRTRQGRAVVRAPFAGVIVNLTIERGEVVAPGAPVARLIQLDPIHVSVSVADRDLAALQVGGVAQVTAAGAAQPVPGKILRFEPAADLQTRTFLIDVEVANPERRLLPGMITQVRFDRESDSTALMLPQDILVTRREGNGVFVVDSENTARWRSLTLGAILGTQVDVRAGLQVGDRVVTQGQRSLSDGDRLLVTREGECCTDGRIVYSKPTPDTPMETDGRAPAAGTGEESQP